MSSFLKFACFLLALMSCTTKTESTKNIPAQTIPEKQTPPLTIPEEGKISKVNIQSDTLQTYNLYVPANVDSNTLLIVFFDPGAKGKKPIEKYKELGKQYGIILAGSNNSKNGLSGEESAAIAKKFVKDIQARLKVKSRNTYACGFSGGARVAVLTTIGENLPGAIGCGAGFPGKPDKNYGFTYVGMVGNEDFNYLEMKRLYQDLERVKMNHHLLVFDGKHEWAPVDEMEKAILCMKSSLAKTDEATRTALAGKIDSAIVSFQQKKEWIRLYDELNFGLSCHPDTAHTKKWKQEFQSLKKNKDCLTTLKNEAEAESKEADTQTEVAKAFSERDFTTLSAKVKLLSQSSAKTTPQKLSDKRLLQFMSLMGFLYSEKALTMDMKLTQQYLEIYGKADPDNHDYYFLMACYYAKSGDKNKSVASLQKAVELGFDDEEKLENSSYLKTLEGMPQFSEVLNKVKQAE